MEMKEEDEEEEGNNKFLKLQEKMLKKWKSILKKCTFQYLLIFYV
jgi:hypothetical protein